jgi:hypothetical protein
MNNNYITQRKLEQCARDLSERDLCLLCDLEVCRYLTTGQLARLRFEADCANPDAALRAANRTVNRLKDLGLIAALDRRVGGIRGGSGALIWSLTSAGCRLLNYDAEDKAPPRKRAFEPSPQFTKHTLAIAEAYIQLQHIQGVDLTGAEFEPACWRDYSGSTLKPDLFAVTSDREYDNHWFFELDLATETPARIIAKCQQYEAYYRAGEEQRLRGLFPRVVWVTVSEKRRDNLRGRIAQSKELKYKNLFTVVLPGELEPLVQKGAGV